MMEWDKENHAGGDGNQQPRGAGLLEFSPPSKMPKNSPSYLIWSIFTRNVGFGSFSAVSIATGISFSQGRELP